MKLSTFKADGRDDLIEFRNYERIPEDDIVEEILRKLKQNEHATVPTKPLQLPYAYVFKCSYKKKPVLVICDDSYGAQMQADDSEILQEVCDYLET